MSVQLFYGENNTFIEGPLVQLIPGEDVARDGIFSDPLPFVKKVVKVIVDKKYLCTIENGRKIPLTVLLPYEKKIPVYHFYHLWVAGNPKVWPVVLHEHIDALICSGLINYIEKVHVGIVGPKDQITLAENIFKIRNIPYQIIAIAESGYEQVTLKEIVKNITDKKGYVLYCHNKGSMDSSLHGTQWRRSMTYYNIYQWRVCLHHLNKHDIVGIHWLTKKDFPYQDIKTPFYGGNFWWSTIDHLKRLDLPKENDRFDAERWIGEADNIKAMNMKKGWPWYHTPDTNT